MVEEEGEVYLFCGENLFLKEEAKKKLILDLVPSGFGGFNYETYDAGDDYHKISNAVNTLPFLTAKKVVVIKNIENLPDAKRTSFLECLKNPNKFTYLILDTEKNETSDKFLKTITKHARTSVFKKATYRQAKDWIQRRLRRDNKNIEKEALELFLELVGYEDLCSLSNESEKLVLYKSGGRTITYEDVESIIGKTSVKTVFDLVDAVGFKNKDLALKLAREFSATSKRRIPEMTGLISWQLRRIWKAKALLARGISIKQVCAELRIASFSIEKFSSQIERFSIDELKGAFKLLISADRDIKTGRDRPEFILERLIVQLCGA